MKTIALFFGGPSNEHKVSIASAKNIAKNFDTRKYKLALIYWSLRGEFFLVSDTSKLRFGKKLAIQDFPRLFKTAILITHGQGGEDGILQSILESQKIKYAGCRRLSSALCMDKGVFKQHLIGHGIDQVKFAVLDFNKLSLAEINKLKIDIRKKFKLPLYVKPANSGSSLGITKVLGFSGLERAIKAALKHDTRIVIEEGLKNPKEIEVAVLGNKELIVSSPGELSLAKEFYSYDDKYKLGEAKPIIPAKLSSAQKLAIKKLATRTYRLYDCSGFARIDFFISGKKIYLNEINTLPGFTDISMYPLLMMNTGLSYRELINRIISLAY